MIYEIVSNAVANRNTTLIGTRLRVPVVTLSTQDNSKLLQQLESGFNKNKNTERSKPIFILFNWTNFSESFK